MGFSRLHNIAKHLLVLFCSLDQKSYEKCTMFNIFPFFVIHQINLLNFIENKYNHLYL